MLILTTAELMAIETFDRQSSTLTIEGQQFSLGPTFSLKMRDAATRFCQQKESEDTACLLVEGNTTITVWKEVKPIVVSPPIHKFDKQKFVKCCEIELTKCIGPMAKVIILELVNSSDSLTANQFIKRIVSKIADPKLAQEFKDNLAISMDKKINS